MPAVLAYLLGVLFSLDFSVFKDTWRLLAASIEIEGEKKPACVAELVFRFYGT